MIDSPEPSLAEGRGRHGCFSMSMRLDIDTMAELESLWSKVRDGTVNTLVSVWTLEILRSRLTRSAIKAMLHFRSRSYDYIVMCDQLLWETTGSDVTIIALSETERKNKSCNVNIRDKSKFETYIRRSVASLVSHSNWSYIVQSHDRDRKWSIAFMTTLAWNDAQHWLSPFVVTRLYKLQGESRCVRSQLLKSASKNRD